MKMVQGDNISLINNLCKKTVQVGQWQMSTYV